MATVIPFTPLCAQDASCDGEPARVLSLRGKLLDRAIEEAWAQRLADEREGSKHANCPRRLRVVN